MKKACFGTLVSSEWRIDIVVRITSCLFSLFLPLVYLKILSCLACLSSKLVNRYLIVLEIVGIYTAAATTWEEAGFLTMEEYIRPIQNTVPQYIATKSLLDLCEGLESVPGA